MFFNSEEDFLEFLDNFFVIEDSNLEIPRGDDCAVLKCKNSICISTDLFLEGTHFKLDYFSPEDIGYKALAVNISDICAMGAKPIGFFLNFIFSEKISKEFLKRLFSEMSTFCNTLGIVLAGGDISRGPILGLSITIWGESRSYLKRSPKPGDLLFVVGEIGLSKTGFFVLEECRDLKDEFPVSVRHFLRPPIFVEEALNIANFNGVHALMDISDGLIKDLHRFVGNNLGAKLFSEAFSVHEEIKKIASIANLNPLEIMLSGGEDYALLGSVGREYLDKLKKMVPIRVIGEVVLRKGIWLDDKPLEVSGFDHFVN